jgi:phosphate transport system substrate-binding protein
MRKILIAVSLLSILVSCSKSSSRIVTLAGSTAFQPYAEKLAEAYLKKNKDITINVQGGGSAVGIQAAISGSADIGMADLVELPPEAAGLDWVIVASDGLAVIVHPTNRVDRLSSNEVKDIFTGSITNWKEVGGDDAPIRVVSREEGSGTRRSFDELALKNAKISPLAIFQNSNGTVKEAVANDPHAIGYISISLVDKKVKPLLYNGVAPTNENVKNGTYPLKRPIFLLTKKELKPAARAFIDFVLSDEGQRILENEGLIPAR